MNFPEWEPAYEAILADMGYDRAGDEAARDWLAERAIPFDLARLDAAGETVAVVGAAPGLAADLGVVERADRAFAASSAARTLREHGLSVDAMVTDLDGAPETAVALSEAGTPVAVHAHGDNRDLLAEWVPRLDAAQVLATTQAAPAGPVENVGGFTDGDRAAFLADHVGAARLTFAGWDFEDPDLDPIKRQKLAWAARLLGWLERRRDERFSLLDGRRERDRRDFERRVG